MGGVESSRVGGVQLAPCMSRAWREAKGMSLLSVLLLPLPWLSVQPLLPTVWVALAPRAWHSSFFRATEDGPRQSQPWWHTVSVSVSATQSWPLHCSRYEASQPQPRRGAPFPAARPPARLSVSSHTACCSAHGAPLVMGRRQHARRPWPCRKEAPPLIDMGPGRPHRPSPSPSCWP